MDRTFENFSKNVKNTRTNTLGQRKSIVRAHKYVLIENKLFKLKTTVTQLLYLPYVRIYLKTT